MRTVCFLLILAVAACATPQKVFSVADLHGDFDHFKMILERLSLASFDKGEVRWTGGDSILVSTGDSVDRGEHSRPIYLAFQELALQAPKHGGEVVNLIGNHELMNIQGDLRYVPQAEFASDGDYGGAQKRTEEWTATGVVGADIRKRYLAAAVRGRTLFVHGGLHPDILSGYGSDLKALDGLNAGIQKVMWTGQGDQRLVGDTGPFWNRFFATAMEEQVCEKVDRTLSMLGADRMVVGHTMQPSGVDVRCKGPAGPRIILGDTIISRAYGFSRPSAIEYSGDNVTAIYFPIGQEGIQRAPLHVQKSSGGWVDAAKRWRSCSYIVGAGGKAQPQEASMRDPLISKGWVNAAKKWRAYSYLVTGSGRTHPRPMLIA